MSITAGQDAVASDFINNAQRNGTKANDAGRVPKLESDGYLHFDFLKDIKSKLTVNTTETTYDATSGHAETTLFTTTLTGGELGTNDAVRFTLYCSDFSAFDTDTITFRLKYGSTTVATLTVAFTATTSVMGGVLTGILAADGSASAQKAFFEIRSAVAAYQDSGQANVGIEQIAGFVSGSSTENSANNLSFTITADFNQSGAGRSVTAEFFVLERIKGKLNA
jgi:hypothetical protein